MRKNYGGAYMRSERDVRKERFNDAFNKTSDKRFKMVQELQMHKKLQHLENEAKKTL